MIFKLLDGDLNLESNLIKWEFVDNTLSLEFYDPTTVYSTQIGKHLQRQMTNVEIFGYINLETGEDVYLSHFNIEVDDFILTRCFIKRADYSSLTKDIIGIDVVYAKIKPI